MNNTGPLVSVPLSQRRSFYLILISCLALYITFYALLKTSPLSHDPHDSYTLQALNWWQGKANLDHDYSYLELAKYREKIYVSFPPVPSLIEFVLVPFFAENTPNNLITSLYSLLSVALIVGLALQLGCTPLTAMTWANLMVLGSSLFPISMFGGVWYTAQALCFLLLILCVRLLWRQTARCYFYALICFALAVGCRPQTIFFGPAVLGFVPTSLRFNFQKINSPEFASRRLRMSALLREYFKYFALPTLIFTLYACYNYIRFDNPFEFGHRYLPEFQMAQFGQFSWHYIAENLNRIFRLPTYSAAAGIGFPRFDGFAFYIANPIFIALFFRLFKFRNKIDRAATLLLLGCVLQIIFLLFHKGMGGWHFGARYFVDMLPFIWLLILRLDPIAGFLDIALGIFGVILNCYGTYFIYRT